MRSRKNYIAYKTNKKNTTTTTTIFYLFNVDKINAWNFCTFSSFSSAKHRDDRFTSSPSKQYRLTIQIDKKKNLQRRFLPNIFFLYFVLALDLIFYHILFFFLNGNVCSFLFVSY